MQTILVQRMTRHYIYSIILSALAVAGCSISRQSTTMQHPFDKQGHRGCRGLMPENTIPAMLKAIDLGVTTLETDASITADGQVILSHEAFFNHEITTRPDGSFVDEAAERSLNMYHMTYREILTYDVGMKPHPRFPQQQRMKAVKPLLADMIDSVENYCRLYHKPLPWYNIETKCLPETDNIFHPEPPAFVALLMNIILAKGIAQRVIIQSFDFRSLQYLHQHYPAIPTAMLIEDTDTLAFDAQLQKLGFTAGIYSPHFSLVTPELVKQCHAKNMRLIPWTVNNKADINRLKKMGVDGIITDYPNLLD